MPRVTNNNDLDSARDLIEHGIPVFTARPAVGDPEREFYFPKAWNLITPDEKELQDWKPGLALLAAAGHGLDVIDIDPKNGASVQAQIALVNSLGIPIVGIVETPSKGAHLYIPSCGLGNAACNSAGVDYRGRTPEGTGAGMTFIPGTMRPRYNGAGYKWIQEIDWIRRERWADHREELRTQVERYLTELGWKSVPVRPTHANIPTSSIRHEICAPPTHLTAELSDLGPEWSIQEGQLSSDRSKRFDDLVGLCRAYGLTYAETVSLMEPWCMAMDKFVNRVEGEVYRSWARRQWS